MGGGCSEVPKPRVLDHVHQDACTEGCGMLLDVDHKSWRSPPDDVLECATRDPVDLHFRGYDRTDRVCPEVF